LAFLVENHPGLLDVDVLKASHHGSRNGFTDDFLNVATPTHIVISAGVHQGFRHPHPEAVDAYEAATNDRVFCTNRHGTIRIYGYQDGRIRVNRQQDSADPCTFTGT
jgi:competence protein ComEC